MDKNLEISNDSTLLNSVVGLIDQARNRVATTVNQELTLLYWNIGKLINDNVLGNKRADYGKQILPTLSVQLETQYGRNFTEKNVRRMMRFNDEFPDLNILPPLAAKLSWSHFIELFSIKTEEARLFYANKAIQETWSKRAL